MKHFTQTVCPLCHSDKFNVLYKSNLKNSDFQREIISDALKNSLTGLSKHSRLVKCTNCSLIYTNPRENLESFIKAYSEVEDPDYLKTEHFRKLLSKKHMKRIMQFKRRGKILDVGCFCGFFLEIAKEKKFKVCGIEPSRWARRIARKRGIKIIGKTVKDLKNEKFDVITMWDVVEHLQDPSFELEKISSHLNNGGILAIGTPNIDNFLVKILGDRHPFFVRMHITLFNPRTLALLLEKNNFKVLDVYWYRRTYPLYYYFSRLEQNFHWMKWITKALLKSKVISNIPLSLTPYDEFMIIAKKN